MSYTIFTHKIPSKAIVFISFIWLTQLFFAVAERPDGPVDDFTVGLFPFPPLAFVNDDGKPDGLFPDLLYEISENESWSVDFLFGSWSEGLDRLQKGENDLMVCVAYTEERDRSMDYNFESVVELWS